MKKLLRIVTFFLLTVVFLYNCKEKPTPTTVTKTETEEELVQRALEIHDRILTLDTRGYPFAYDRTRVSIYCNS